VDYLPSPLDVPETHGLNPDNGERIFRHADDKEPFSALAFKIMGRSVCRPVDVIRVYSGQLKTGDSVLNTGRRRTERIGRLLKMHANKREENQRNSGGRYLRCGGTEGREYGRHDLQRRASHCARKHYVCGSRDFGCGGA